jgi:hypothetical protein
VPDGWFDAIAIRPYYPERSEVDISDEAVEALRAYEFHAGVCGDRKVIKLTAEEAAQVALTAAYPLLVRAQVERTVEVTRLRAQVEALTVAASEHDRDCIVDASRSGVDQTPLDDPNKLWRCDECRAVGTSAARRPDTIGRPEQTLAL